MITLFLIRHAETDSTNISIVGNQPGIPLNRRGREQVAELMWRFRTIPLAAIYTSPLERAVETAQPIANQHKLELRRTGNLAEHGIGAWEGGRISDLEERKDWREFHLFRSMLRPPGGETLVEVQARMLRQFECIRQEHDGGAVAVVSHAEPIRGILAHWLGIPLDLAPRVTISPASVTTVDLHPWGPRIECVNEICGRQYE